MCRAYLGRNIIVLGEQFRIHINGQMYAYQLEEVFHNDIIKTIKKRRRKDRPKYIVRRLLDIAIDKHYTGDNDSGYTAEYKKKVNTWIENNVVCKFEIKPFETTCFGFKWFPFLLKNQMYLQENDVLNSIIWRYLRTTTSYESNLKSN
jgi:hypothetical protein